MLSRKSVIPAALLCGALSSPANAQSIATYRHFTKAVTVVPLPKRVLALYYPWYGSPEFSGKWLHQDGVNTVTGTIASHTHYPLSGPYDSADPAVIERHLKQAKSAGIDTLVCSWWGRNDLTDVAIQMLLKQAPKYGMTVCIFWEPYRPLLTPQAARADLAYILQAFGKQPGYLRSDGKPVVFLYSRTSQALASSQWAEVLKETAGKNSPGILAIADNEAQTDSQVWGGSYSLGAISRMGGLNQTQSAQMLHQIFQSQRAGNRPPNYLTVETLAPGYDDRRQNGAPGALVDRQSGQRYRSLWEQALKDAPDWILINSFNQWHNGTEIEPSREMGSDYLQMTRLFAERFKAANRLPIQRPTPGIPSER